MHKMEASTEVHIENSFVALAAPYPLSSCRRDPGEPYHSSICKWPRTWATAWACWDWELIYANLRETVTAQHNTEPATDTGGVAVSPRQHNNEMGENVEDMKDVDRTGKDGEKEEKM